jgi:hypothetical protein
MRTFSNALKSVLAGSSLGVRTIARLNLGSGLYRVCDGEENLSWGGATYTAFGEALVLDPGAITTDGRGQGSNISLSGTDPAVLNTFFNEVYRGRSAEMALLFLDPATGQPFEEVLLASGKMEVVTHAMAAQRPGEPDKPTVSTLTLTLTAATSEMERSGVRTRSDTDQKTHRAGDGFYKDVNTAGKSQISWGKDGSSSPIKAAASINGGGANLAGLGLGLGRGGLNLGSFR